MEIFEFLPEERETTINYQSGKWSIYSSVPDHIKRLLALHSDNIVVESISKDGAVTSVGGNIIEQEMYYFLRS